jgi:hypothetical protein
MATTTTPDITGVVDQSFFASPLGGPQHPISYLDRFPESIYNKGIDSHLVRFMYALLGPAGVGWLRKNYLEARLKLEDFGIDTFDLDKFYGDPLSFGRILEEVYDEDPKGLLTRDQWERIKAKDAAYRNRAVDYVRGARAGNTPLGMKLVARSGLGHEVEVIENYRYIYDQLSDDPLGIPKHGFTNSTNEMIVLPRRELPRSEVQTITISGSPTGGRLRLFFPVANEAVAEVFVAYNATAFVGDPVPVGGNFNNIRAALETIPAIGRGNVIVTGGPFPDNPISVQFTGALGYSDVPQLISTNELTGGTSPAIAIETTQSAIDTADEVVSISPRDKHYLREAMSRIKPVTAILSYGSSPGLTQTQVWNAAYSTSEYHEVVRFVTGQTGVPWPNYDSIHWIESAIEHQAPRVLDDLQHHYRGFHNIGGITASSRQVGQFTPFQTTMFPVLGFDRPDDYEYDPDRALADYAEPLTVTANTRSSNPVQLINGIYPVDYSSLPGVPSICYEEEQFWASDEQAEGPEYLEIDFGTPQAVNYLYFETTRKPCDIEISYDLLDGNDESDWRPVTLTPGLPASTSVGYDPGASNPWQTLEFYFNNAKGQMIYARRLRINLTRRNDLNSPFNTGVDKLPFSIEIRNLRAARNV